MRFYHYTSTPVALDLTRTYIQPSYAIKPMGLWLSVEDDGDGGWRDWCIGEDWNVGGLECRVEVRLRPAANILWMSTEVQLRDFTRTFRNLDAFPALDLVNIDWQRVTTRYDGLVIAPYIWPCRLSLDTFWYYGWDCASGCLWNLERTILP